ncbi:MAG: PIN domain-containing protein [Beijerinckiaceae bacterium]|nr:PIN domain-containing protein [Beijerinckiaceae bacterium]
MFADCFLDTNVLFYAALGRFTEPGKYERARQVIAETHFGLSGQVMQEFFVNVTRKTARPLTTTKALEWLDALGDRPFVSVDRQLVGEAAAVADRYQISYWDAALIAAAERLGAPVLYTEDLNHDQTYGSVRVVNPFRAN